MSGVTQTEFARQSGVSKQYINKLVKMGKIPVLDNGRIDPDLARLALDQIRDPARSLGSEASDDAGERNPSRPASGDPSPEYDDEEPAASKGPSFNRVSIAHKGWQAKKAELEYRQAAGQLVDKGEVEREAFESARIVRDRMMAIPMEVAGALVGMSNEQEIAAFLRSKIRDALMETSAHVGIGA